MENTFDPLRQPLPNEPLLLREMVLSLRQEKAAWLRREDLLLEQLRLLRAQRFGRSSEKAPFDHPSIFDEAELESLNFHQPEEEPAVENASVVVAEHTRRKTGPKPLPADLPREEVIHDLPAEEKICGLDGHALVEIDRETSEQLDIVPAQIKVIRHVRIKYGCPHCRQGVKIAPAPLRPIPKALATAGMLAYVAVSKYADALPLYRQEKIFVRYGIELNRATLANWMIQTGNLVQPLINLIRDHILDYGVIQMDETTVQVLKEADRPATSKSYMWVQRGGPPNQRALLFDYDPSRGGKVPKELLAGYQGWLQTDGYDGYLAVGILPGVDHVACWAHVRRKFVEAVKAAGTGGKTAKAQRGVALISKLYAIEKNIRDSSPEHRREVRQREVPPIFREIREWMDDFLPKVTPSSATGKSLAYLQGQWPRLVRYIEDGRLELDNNGAENAIRPFVVGRKNWLFSDSVRGAKSSANLYSLIETAKANGLEPYAYLRHIFDRIPAAQTLADFEKLLPWNLSSNMQPKINPAD